ncbi:MAG: argininosuccinate lyase [Candidatus Omnitrophica bacterium]|nr:argininosuccinate lyase [Candidatus Omnitrophota bacterium]MBU4488922.1 argininosuccinate lyase [Candidatus Omnitrophota bacterium]MCG2705318.1 argininosuccinate lyase [Candidatus Omnitrophota bacterium]
MSKKMWGGRFKKEIDRDFFEFQKSIHYDYKLAKYDIVHSLIHTVTLADAKFLSLKEKEKLIKALEEISKNVKEGKFAYDAAAEDIHTDIQNKVAKKVGKLALKLHTLRSRNDQIAFDEKGYCYDESFAIAKLLDSFLKSLSFLGKKYGKHYIVGYTHTQRAQKVLFANYIATYYAMFARDKKRLEYFYSNIPLYIGAGALAGSSIAKFYNDALAKTKKKLLTDNIFVKEIKPFLNSLDAVSDRDFLIELLSILAIIQMHLSRLAEDLILYSTKEFNFINLPEEFCTGSSMMPHKKNPDFLELVRGYTGRIYGNLMSVLTIMKGLPLTYNRDMQLDKEPLFSSVDTVKNELEIMAHFLIGVELKTETIKAALKDIDLAAVDMAEKLVRDKKMPFKEAHDMVGRYIRSAEEKKAKR